MNDDLKRGVPLMHEMGICGLRRLGSSAGLYSACSSSIENCSKCPLNQASSHKEDKGRD